MNNRVFVFGNQKAGTTAIAALLAKAVGCSVTLDIPAVWQNERDLHAGTLSVDRFISSHMEKFMRGVVKEPCLTFLYDKLMPHFPNAGQVFIVRHPAENIRSILDRLETPGNLSEVQLEDYERFGAWKEVIDGSIIGIHHPHYIVRLAMRWTQAAEVYLTNHGCMELVRYESFLSDKVGVINNLVKALGLTLTHDITNQVDVQYQRKGRMRGVSWHEYFGERNLALIADVTRPYLAAFGYSMDM